VVGATGASERDGWEAARARLIYALDYPTLDEARAGATQVRAAVGTLKVGLELFVRAGPEAVGLGRELERDVFLDLKLHDIPATVERAVGNAITLGARFLTVHAAGGAAMLRAATARAAGSALDIVAVTVLTSLDAADLAAQGLAAKPGEHALRLARLAWLSDVRTFVCSAAEAPMLRQELGPTARIITPGIRPGGAGAQDQKRVTTPAEAIANGADLLVVGRPIRDAADPLGMARRIVEQIAEAAPARTRS
jgi:orotidine-5'-phosphate decarboxylase